MVTFQLDMGAACNVWRHEDLPPLAALETRSKLLPVYNGETVKAHVKLTDGTPDGKEGKNDHSNEVVTSTGKPKGQQSCGRAHKKATQTSETL